MHGTTSLNFERFTQYFVSGECSLFCTYEKIRNRDTNYVLRTQVVKPIHKRTARIVVCRRHYSRVPELYRT